MSRRPVPFLGLTGAIGAGKTEALKALERLGAATLSTDAVVHELLETDDLRDLVVERLGSSVAPRGTIDREEVAKLVFAAPDEREWLEGVLWPRVGQRVLSFRDDVEQREPPPRAAVVEVPLLFEAGMESAFDKTIAIVAGDHLRARRAHKQGHKGLGGRAQRQLSQNQKSERADFTVRNDGSLRTLEQRLSEVLDTMDAQSR